MLRTGQYWPITKEMVARERTSCGGLEEGGMRRRAVEALIAIGDPRGLAICFDVYDVRGSAPVSSPNVIGKVGFQPLVEALADPRPAVRGLAATWLVKSFGVRAILPVQAAFASIGVEGRAAIVEAVARLADPAAEAFLDHVAAGDADLEVRLAAVGGLLKARTPQALEAVGRAADADPSAQVRLTAKRALETLPGRPHPAVLTRRWIDRAEVAPFTR
jgi:HEAT repeat protein